MKKLKFLIISLLVCLLGLSLFACGGSEKRPSQKEETTVSEEITSSDTQTTSSEDISSEEESNTTVSSEEQSSQTTAETTSQSSEQTSESSVQVEYYSVTIQSTSSYGSVTANKYSDIEAGTTVTLNVSANQYCKLDYLKVNNVELSVSNGVATFTIMQNSVVTYSFSQIKYNIVCTANANGTVNTSPANSAIYGATVTVTATPNANYTLESITISYGGNSSNLAVNNNSATFTMPAQAVTVSATFVAVDTREYVSHLVLGDSLAAINHWQDFYADFAELSAPKIIGVGGTCVEHWITGLNSDFEFNGQMRSADIVHKYNVSNFIFHVCDNDIDGGTDAATVIQLLKTMFTAYHNAYPNAKIYWNTMSYSSFDYRHPEGYTAVNNAIKEYAQGISYLTVIDTASVMFPDNQPVADWFVDGTHFNPDGLATWSALLLDALGYPRAKVAQFGKAGNYYTSSTFSANVNGTVSNQGRDQGEQSVWFDGVYAENAYAEMKVTVNSITNDEAYPKFGMAIKTNSNHLFFFIDAVDGLTGKATGLTERILGDNGGDWNWGMAFAGDGITGDYSNGSYVKLGLLKTGGDVYFFVNDVLVRSATGIYGISGNAALGLTLFNLNVTIKDFSITTNVDTAMTNLGMSAQGARIRYEADNAVIQKFFGVVPFNNDVAGEGSLYAADINSSKLYFETDIVLRGVLGGDEYPKAGIAVNNVNVGTLLFYIDAVNTGDFGGTKRVGYVFRPNGGTWDWDHSNSTYALGMEYVAVDNVDHYVNIAVLKDGAKFSFLVNGVPVIDVERSDLAGNAKVGIMEFNLAFAATNERAALSDKMISKLIAEKGISGEVVIDGNISEWTAAQKAKSYSMKTADGVRGFTAYAFRGQKAVYIAIEMVSSTFVNNSANWWESTNAELRVGLLGAYNDQTYVSANGLSTNVRSYKITTSQNGGYYTTIIEISISLSSIWYGDDIGLGFAACTGGETAENVNPDGGTAAWWPGSNWPTDEVVKV